MSKVKNFGTKAYIESKYRLRPGKESSTRNVEMKKKNISMK